MVNGYVLLVDDERDVLQVLGDVLDAEGFRTALASDGADALAQIASRGVPSLVVCDANMPTMGGTELIQRLRQDRRTASVPIALVSGETSVPAVPGDVLRLSKPVDTSALVAFARQSRARRGRREIQMIVASLRSALDRVDHDSTEGFRLLSRAVRLLDDLADGQRLAPDELKSLATELAETYRAVEELRRQRRRTLAGNQAIDDGRELADTEWLEEGSDVLATLERGLVLAERLDRG